MNSLHLRRASGFTLIEVLMVIVVIGVAAAALTTLSMRGGTQSAEMLRTQQAGALASALLDEVRSMPFTYCDPNDPSAGTATSAAGCATPELPGPEGGELRLSGVLPLDNVSDYNGLTLAGATLRDITNVALSTNLPQVAGCTVRFSVQPTVFAGITVASGDALRILVTVNCPGISSPVIAEGLRVRYAPNQYQY